MTSARRREQRRRLYFLDDVSRKIKRNYNRTKEEGQMKAVADLKIKTKRYIA